MALIDCIDVGTLKLIPADDRSASLNDTSVSDTWETADFSSYVRKGTQALLLYTFIRTDSTQDRTLLVTRGDGESQGANFYTQTLRLYAEIGNSGYIYIGAPIIIYAPDGKFDYRRFSSTYPISQLYCMLWGYFI
jgi:hypothetical protein